MNELFSSLGQFHYRSNPWAHG